MTDKALFVRYLEGSLVLATWPKSPDMKPTFFVANDRGDFISVKTGVIYDQREVLVNEVLWDR